jgi:hypothetical protein
MAGERFAALVPIVEDLPRTAEMTEVMLAETAIPTSRWPLLPESQKRVSSRGISL